METREIVISWGGRALWVLKTRLWTGGMKLCNKRTKSCRRRERRTTWKNITSSYVSLSICQLQGEGISGSSYQAIGTFVSDFTVQESHYFHSCYSPLLLIASNVWFFLTLSKKNNFSLLSSFFFFPLVFLLITEERRFQFIKSRL